MALIKCPDCGTEVSDRADKCPKCSCPISYKPPQEIKVVNNQKGEGLFLGTLNLGCAIIAGIIILACLVGIFRSVFNW